jgi:hypothetical protein
LMVAVTGAATLILRRILVDNVLQGLLRKE